MNETEDLWDKRYAQDDYVFGVEPNAFLVRQADRLQPGWRALAVADGEGRNGVWLAERGLTVLAVDKSRVGLEKAKRLAQERGVGIQFDRVDLADWAFPSAQFDVVAAIFIQFASPALRTRLFAQMCAALKPGGLLLLQGYRPEQIGYGTGGPSVAENLYTEDLLREAFSGLEILELRSHDSVIHEGRGHSGVSALIELVGRAPG